MRNKKTFLSMLSLAVITIAMPIACSPSAQFTVDSLAIKPAKILAGETASISAQITNTGGAEGFYRATLSVDDERIDTKDIDVGPGATQTATFPISKDKSGTYRISIGEKTATLTVKPKLVAKQTELKYDDGQAKDCLSLVKPATGYLVSFASPSDPFTISQVRVFGLVYGSPGFRVSDAVLQIWDKDNKVLYTAPFTGDKFPLRTRLGPNIDSTGGWVDIDIPNVNVEGNYYIHIYTGNPTGQGFRMGAEDNVKNTHSDVTVRGDNGIDNLSPNWPYSIAYWYGYKGSVNWMVRVVGNAMVSQE